MHLKVKHNHQVRQIALYNGLAAEELSSILQAVFSLSASSVVVGLLSPEVGGSVPSWLEGRYDGSFEWDMEFRFTLTLLGWTSGTFVAHPTMEYPTDFEF